MDGKSLVFDSNDVVDGLPYRHQSPEIESLRRSRRSSLLVSINSFENEGGGEDQDVASNDR